MKTERGEVVVLQALLLDGVLGTLCGKEIKMRLVVTGKCSAVHPFSSGESIKYCETPCIEHNVLRLESSSFVKSLYRNE